MYGNVGRNMATAGFASTPVVGGFNLAWTICLSAMLASLGLALLRFVPREER
jgi:hypothetical protein